MKWLSRSITSVFCVFVSLPILWLLYAAFLPPEIVSSARLLPGGFSLANFAALHGSGLFQALLISLLVSTMTVLGQLMIGLLTAYSMHTGFKLLPIVLLILALPSELILVPLYRQLQILHLLDTLWVLVLPFLTSPLVIFLLFQSLKRLNQELFEAAEIDGATHWIMVWRIVTPLLRPELIAAGILSFAAHWNLVLFPKVMITDKNLWTVQVFLNELLKNRPLDWGLLGAASFAATLPIIILYLVFEKRVVEVFEMSFR